MSAPAFDGQSARALLYALLVEAGELAGFTADADEVNDQDAVGFEPVVRQHGRELVRMRAIWGRGQDRETAQRFALDVARLHAVDLLLTVADNGPDWLEALRRFRRSPADPSANPVTLNPEQNGDDNANES